MQDFLRVADLDRGELFELLDIAAEAKNDPKAFNEVGAGKVVAVLFEKPSLRTRFSVEAAIARLGAHPIGAYDREVGLGSRESIDDAGRVLSRYADAIVLRTFEHARVEELAAAADVPVVNALTDQHHPMQALADLQTAAEACCDGDPRGLKDVRFAWVGDGNNVAVSLVEACALAGAGVALACPRGHELPPATVTWATEHGAAVTVTNDPHEAVRNADVVYTDVWVSMGQESEASQKLGAFDGFQVDQQLMSAANAGAIFLHCLPAHRGEEVSAEVIDGPASRVFDQAENRLHTTLAVLARLFGGR